ncbi:hypothetical protein B484DRAFT_456663, partial [Ochromonadaceae sp. CCMP2298]
MESVHAETEAEVDGHVDPELLLARLRQHCKGSQLDLADLSDCFDLAARHCLSVTNRSSFAAEGCPLISRLLDLALPQVQALAKGPGTSEQEQFCAGLRALAAGLGAQTALVNGSDRVRATLLRLGVEGTALACLFLYDFSLVASRCSSSHMAIDALLKGGAGTGEGGQGQGQGHFEVEVEVEIAELLCVLVESSLRVLENLALDTAAAREMGPLACGVCVRFLDSPKLGGARLSTAEHCLSLLSQVLSAQADNVALTIDAGGVGAVLGALRRYGFGNVYFADLALGTLQSLAVQDPSMRVVRQVRRERAMPLLLDCVRAHLADSQSIAESGIGAIGVVALQSPAAMVQLAQAGGLLLLLEALNRHEGSADVVAKAFRVLLGLVELVRRVRGWHREEAMTSLVMSVSVAPLLSSSVSGLLYCEEGEGGGEGWEGWEGFDKEEARAAVAGVDVELLLMDYENGLRAAKRMRTKKVAVEGTVTHTAAKLKLLIGKGKDKGPGVAPVPEEPFVVLQKATSVDDEIEGAETETVWRWVLRALRLHSRHAAVPDGVLLASLKLLGALANFDPGAWREAGDLLPPLFDPWRHTARPGQVGVGVGVLLAAIEGCDLSTPQCAYTAQVCLETLQQLCLSSAQHRLRLSRLQAHRAVVRLLAHGSAPDCVYLCELGLQTFALLHEDVSAQEANEGSKEACLGFLQILRAHADKSQSLLESGMLALRSLALYAPNKRILGEQRGCHDLVLLLRAHCLGLGEEGGGGGRSMTAALHGLDALSLLAGEPSNQSRIAKCGGCKLLCDL